MELLRLVLRAYIKRGLTPQKAGMDGGGYALRILASASPPSRGTPNLNEHYYLPTHHVNVKLLRYDGGVL